MTRDRYSPVIRSLHRVSHGAHKQALDELSEVWRRALQAGETAWAAVLLWHCMIITESIGDWPRAIEYGERVLLLQDDAYLRLFLFRAYRQLGDDAKAAAHLRASVDLADETRDQMFLETLIQSATVDDLAPTKRTRRRPEERSGAPRWDLPTMRARRPASTRACRPRIRTRDV